MRLCCLSPFRSASRDTVLSFLKGCTANFVMLPGAQENTPTPLQVQAVIGSGTTVFVEGKGGKKKATPYFVTSSNLRAMPPQIFSQNPSADDVDALAKVLPARTCRIGSRRITVFMCGELIAFNPDGSVKHNRLLPYDIIANPAHTMMRHWNYLGRKLETLSKRTIVMYAANNNCDHSRVTTDVRIYHNGRLLTSNAVDKLAWSECEI